MSVFFRRRGEPPATTVDVVLIGIFDSSYGYVTIDGTKYTSAQTLTVAKGTSVTVYCKAFLYAVTPVIKLNGTIVASATSSSDSAKYTFAVTENCRIVLAESDGGDYTADITMPA